MDLSHHFGDTISFSCSVYLHVLYPCDVLYDRSRLVWGTGDKIRVQYMKRELIPPIRLGMFRWDFHL